MRPMRVLLVLLLIGAGLGASLVLVSKAARSLHGSPLFQISPSTTTSTPAVRRARAAPATPPLRASAGAAAPRPTQVRHQQASRPAPTFRRRPGRAGGDRA